LKAVESLRLIANPDNPAQHGVSWGALIDRYIAEELPRRKNSAKTIVATLKISFDPMGRLRPS
jgi:hypothetical protein